MNFLGKREFDFGSDSGIQLIDMFSDIFKADNYSISMYLCPRCSKIEFFSFDVGEADMPTEIDCMQCGAVIPADQDACPGCGWTWEKSDELT